MGNVMVGGVYGDLKEYGGNIAECICCMMCLGPVLLIIGVAVFFQSFSDHRLAAISEYDLAVSTWNSGPGADRSFEGLGISAILTTGIVGAATEILMGGVAPEPTGDKSLRPEEKFTEVSNPYYYKNEGAGVSIQAFEPTANSEYTLSFSGESVKVSTGKVTFKPLIDVSAQYDWYVSRSSSASSDSIDCINPNYSKCPHPLQPSTLSTLSIADTYIFSCRIACMHPPPPTLLTQPCAVYHQINRLSRHKVQFENHLSRLVQTGRRDLERVAKPTMLR